MPTVLPFTQIYETVMKESREMSTQDDVRRRYKDRVNYIYQFELPDRHEFRWMTREGSITTTAEHTDGTVDVTAGGTTVTGTSTNFTSAMTDRKIKFDDNDDVYTFTHSSATSGTISPALSGSTDLDDATYTIYQDVYALPADFLRMATDREAVYYHIDGTRQEIHWVSDDLWGKRKISDPSDRVRHWRMGRGLTSLGLSQIQFTPPPSTARVINVEYIKAFSEMEDFRFSGSGNGVTMTAPNPTSVTIVGVDRTAFATANRYFRYDANGAWRKINSAAFAGGDTTLTLANGYPISTTVTNSTSGYTLSDAPEIPPTAQRILVSGGLWRTAMEQGDRRALEQRAGDFIDDIRKVIATQARERYGRKYMQLGDQTYEEMRGHI